MFRIVLALSFLLLPAVVSGTTVLLLKDGGTLEGELLNPDEVSRKTYRIKTAGGLEISLDVRLVERVQGWERPALVEYNAKAPFSEHTVENHYTWARWCNENLLLDQAKIHWQQVLELDTDHADARRALGYEKTSNGWFSQRERLEDRGFIQDRGRWKTAQQIEVANILETRKYEDNQWRRTIRDLCRRLPNSEPELLAIRDPAAVEPLKDALASERNPYARKVLILTLVRIPSASAIRFVVGWSVLATESDELRQTSVEELLRLSKNSPEVRQIMIEAYRVVLRPNVQTNVVTMAAKALAEIGAHDAVPELIDVLAVTRVETIQPQGLSHSFGSGGTSIGQGGSRPVQRPIRVENQAVLAALTKLTGLNYQFDQARWREWYRQSHRSPSFNLRRD